MTGVTAQGAEVHGEVDRVLVRGDEVTLGLEDGSFVPLDRVLQVNANDESEG